MAVGPKAMDNIRKRVNEEASEIEKHIDAVISDSWDPADPEHQYTLGIVSVSVAREVVRRYIEAGWLVRMVASGPQHGITLVFSVPGDAAPSDTGVVLADAA